MSESGASQLHKSRSFCAWDPSGPHFIYFFIRQFICILYNSTIKCKWSAFLSCELFKQIIKPEGCENPQFTACQSEIQLAWDLQVASEMGQSCGIEPYQRVRKVVLEKTSCIWFQEVKILSSGIRSDVIKKKIHSIFNKKSMIQWY